LLLLDEPFSAQNEAGRGLMKQLLDRECEQGRSLLLALHDIHEEIESVQIQSEI
jgi:ABC-type cobalamin transport system ATPase subunit